ncbi:MAG: hypothetical protein AAFY15_01985, partial [Cyanobacteria bacterium J06648_11]
GRSCGCICLNLRGAERAMKRETRERRSRCGRIIGWHVAWLTVLCTGIGGVGSWRSLPVMAASSCTSSPDVWAETMTAQLATYANRQFARMRSTFHVTLVGFPEVEVLSTARAARLGVESETEEVAQLVFSTSERRRYAWDDGTASTPSLQRHYVAYLSRQSVTEPWYLASLIAAQPARPSARGLAPHAETAGILAGAIRTWQREGCPAPSDWHLAGDRDSTLAEPEDVLPEPQDPPATRF